MKSYTVFLSEISDFRKNFRESEMRYPGVHMFMTIAARFLNRPEKLKDPKLVRLLKRLRIKGDINAFSKSDFNRVYRFITQNNLNTVEDVRLFFSNAKAGISNDTTDAGIYDDDEDSVK